MAVLELPSVNTEPSYRYQIDLEGSLYFIDMKFNTRNNRWAFSIFDQDQEPIIVGIPVLIDLDLLGQYVDPRLPPGKFMAVNLANERVEADRDGLSNDIIMIYFTSDELT